MAPSKTQKIAGWILSGVISLMLIGPSALGKFTDWEGKDQMFDHLGYSTDLMKTIGVVEVIVAILFVIPRTGFVGAILITGYLGGAIATHVRVGDPFFMPIVIGIAVWIGLALRHPEIFSLAFGTKQPDHTTATSETATTTF